jgi:hypothetical protein
MRKSRHSREAVIERFDKIWMEPVRIAILFGVIYFVVGVAFPNPSEPGDAQFMWRLAAWATCAVAFATHIGLEHFRWRIAPGRTALHAASAVALGAFGLAAAANIHALSTGTGNRLLLGLSLIIWPVMTGVVAFVAAWVMAAMLGLVWPRVSNGRRS